MRTLLIEPATYAHQADENSRQSVPTLGLALPLIAALMPPDIDVTIAYDVAENIEEDYDLASFDLVGVTCSRHSGQIARSLELAETLNKLGVPSVVGGPVTIEGGHRFVPMLSRSFDAVVVGEAESALPHLLRDVRQNALKKVYHFDNDPRFEGLPVPRFDLVNFDLFTPPHVFPAQTARGCPRACTFCSEFLYSRWRYRPVDEVVMEFKSYQSNFGAKLIIFRDDDFLVYLRRSRELLPKLRPIGLEWACQTDLHLAGHLEVAELAVEAGLRSVCFGLESLREDNREDMGKNFFTMDEARQLLRLLNERGVETQINIIFGLDHDTPDIFDETVDFLLENRVSTVYFNVLSPIYGTALYKQLEEEGRILDLPALELGEEDAAQVNFMPKNMTAEQLVSGAMHARKRFLAERSPDLNFWLGPEKTEY